MIDVMLADMPRIEYAKDKNHVTIKDVQKAEEKNKKIEERVKAHGIGANLMNKIDTNAFVKAKMN